MIIQVQQVVAKQLGVDMDIIKIKPSTNFVSPNMSPTGGSAGSEMSCAVVLYENYLL